MKTTNQTFGSQKRSFIHGFTLIEMLVVIAIIGILTAIIVTNLSGAKAKARDAKRISDMGNIQLALELYFDRCDQYPSATTDGAVGQGGGAECSRKKPDGGEYSMSDFITTIPVPPTGNSEVRYDYFPASNSNNKVINYNLQIGLEVPNSVPQEGLTEDNRLPGSPIIQCDHISYYCIGPK